MFYQVPRLCPEHCPGLGAHHPWGHSLQAQHRATGFSPRALQPGACVSQTSLSPRAPQGLCPCWASFLPPAQAPPLRPCAHCG